MQKNNTAAMQGVLNKKQKKLQQPPKKNQNCVKVDKNTETEIHHNNNTINDEEELLSNSAFFQSIVKQKLKSKNDTDIKNHYSKKSNNNRYNNINDPNTDSLHLSDALEGFTTVVRNRAGIKSPNEYSPEVYQTRAHNCILQRQKFFATEYLSRVIDLDPLNMRHYINRSYCYLNTGNYSRALDDIHRVLTNIDNPIHLSLMKCREGQALWGQENYEGAMNCFIESLNFMPNCKAVECEIMRMKVVALIRLGFPERDVLELLQDNPSMEIKDAVTYLSVILPENRDEYIVENGENDIFQSDNEECPSNTRIFQNIIDFDGETEDKSWYNEHQMPKKQNDSYKKVEKTEKVKNKLSVKSPARTQKSVPNIVKKCVWVGNITPKITPSILTKQFAKFGKVTSVDMRSRYALVYFAQGISVESALKAKIIRIDGTILPIKLPKL